MTTAIPSFTAGRLERPDGAVIHYEVGGEGPPVVFAHGLGGNHLSWWQSAPAFAEFHKVVAFSHRGFAPSTTPGGVPDPTLYASDLLALLDHLAIPKAVIIGQSMGRSALRRDGPGCARAGRRPRNGLHDGLVRL